MVQVIALHPRATIEHAGSIPYMLSDDSSLSIREQLDVGYRHGGGWQPFRGFELLADDSLSYPGDPPQRPILEFQVEGRDQRVLLYEHSWVAIINPDRSFEVCRMD